MCYIVRFVYVNMNYEHPHYGSVDTGVSAVTIMYIFLEKAVFVTSNAVNAS